jgi:predicted alpha-1,2-mannosidase
LEKLMNFGKSLLLFISILFVSCNQSNNERYTDYVDPFIGTGGHGHTFPGATVPFGMIQLSPDNPSKGWDWTSGYHYSDSILLGFSHTHLSGTGVGDLLDILVLPFTSEYPTNTENEYDRIYSKYTHEKESAEPGYYSIEFDNRNINAELTATERVGFHKYSFNNGANAQILLDLGYAQNYDKTVESKIEIIDNRTVVGYRKSTGWAKHQPTYFAIEFSEPFIHSLYNIKSEIGEDVVIGDSTSAVFSFNIENNSTVMLKVALSSATIDGAIKNLKNEIPNWNFEQVRNEASDKWEKELSKIQIQSDRLEEKKIFYTALYHSFIAPYLFSDANNEYNGADDKTHKAENYNKYTLFSLWDTFRALHPLITITKPDIVDDFVKSMLSFYDEYKLLPTWDLLSNETDVMIGYHAVPVIYDAYKKGLTTADPERIFAAMVSSAMQDTFGIGYFKKYGYIPSELELEAVSKVLEYSFDDWCIAQMAKDLGKDDDYKYFMNRAQSYKTLFDKKVGFMRGKDKDGNWVENFSPTNVEHRKTDYTEANAWQYTWHVLHDVDGLIDQFGSERIFVNKLDSLFTINSHMEGEVSPDISGLIGQYAHGNEPCHHITYLYSHTGQSWKAAEKVNQIRKTMYKDDPDGLAGNDDCGQMSAWYVFSSMGFYPLNPADSKYWFGTPMFKETIIDLDNNKIFKIVSEDLSKENIYIQSVKLNGLELDRNYITHGEIMNGGELIFKLGSDK